MATATLHTITAQFFDKSGKPIMNLNVQSRYKGSLKANNQKTKNNGYFIFQASPNRVVEILAKPPNESSYIVFKTVNSSSNNSNVKIQLPKTLEDYKSGSKSKNTSGIVSTFFKIIDSNGKIMVNFPIQSRPLGKSNSPDKLTDEKGIVEVKSSPNRDFEVLVLTSKDQFQLKVSMNSINGTQQPILIKLDEPYDNFKGATLIKILAKDGKHYVLKETNVEMIVNDKNKKNILIKDGKITLYNWVGEKITLTVYKPNGKPLDSVSYLVHRVKKEFIDLQLDVDVLEGKTAQDDPTIPRKIEDPVKGICLCNRDMSLDELRKMILEMRKSEGLKTTSLFTHKNCTLEDKSIETLLKSLNSVFKKYEINTCLRKINFIGQIYWEAARFITTTEFASGTYLNPNVHKSAIANGNTATGDGPRYKGRGFMQLTWRNNYNRYFTYVLKNKNYYSSVISGDLTINDLMDRTKKYSEFVASKNLLAMDSAGWFWLYGTNLNLNEQADNNAVSTISRKVNGGGNGKKERAEYNSRLLKIMNYTNCVNKKTGIG